MCGFFGVVGKIDEARALRALDRIAHRGKDERGVYKRENLFLGHNRLYIVDKDAHQPMESEEKVVVFNGEIYNYEALQVPNDTAAILKVAPDFKRLDGMFAFGLADKKRLYLAKDIFGKKPLYYYEGADFFCFASEIKAIEEYVGRLEFEKEALSSYLSFGAVPDRRTFYRGVRKLLGGELLSLDIATRDFRIERFDTPLKWDSFDLEAVLQESVKKRLQGDFEVAALLSGGVDSSLVSAMAKKLQGELHTFSIGYEEGRYSELPFAKEVSRHIGSLHHEVIFKEENFFESLEFLVDHYDEPIGDSAALPLWYLLGKVKEAGFRVVLSGEGGDELFLGYRQYFEFFDLYKARELKYKNWLKNYFKAHFSPNKEWEWYKRALSDEEIFRSSCEVFTDLQKNLFLRQNVRDGESLQALEPVFREWEEHGWQSLWDFFSFVDLRVRLEALYLKKLDMTSMAHTIEARTPLLDSAVASAAFGDPRRSEGPKAALKRVARHYIPRSVIERKKRGFSYPHMEWIQRSDLIEKMREINDQILFFKPDQLDFLIQSAKRNRFSRHFWLVLAFLLWFERKFL
ncbi:MAG: asparagine synthase (glutamine-hydrolyzing) [Epsilonproteobacteria bacterium]|nr:asparagine synthase (glutamine-hydrolyzing) [Campylobacterota bacterium]NPA63781.1 asparagine synthase (glutamine-hydrolyzing) [Campylobacterota bacterium]